MTTQQLILLLKENKAYLKQHAGLKTMSLFGSWANGTADENSDVDILVELRKPKFMWVINTMLYLENKTGKKIDLVRKGAHLSEAFLQTVEKEKIDV